MIVCMSDIPGCRLLRSILMTSITRFATYHAHVLGSGFRTKQKSIHKHHSRGTGVPLRIALSRFSTHAAMTR